MRLADLPPMGPNPSFRVLTDHIFELLVIGKECELFSNFIPLMCGCAGLVAIFHGFTIIM